MFLADGGLGSGVPFWWHVEVALIESMPWFSTNLEKVPIPLSEPLNIASSVKFDRHVL